MTQTICQAMRRFEQLGLLFGELFRISRFEFRILR